jgi:hypothetical protein
MSSDSKIPREFSRCDICLFLLFSSIRVPPFIWIGSAILSAALASNGCQILAICVGKRRSRSLGTFHSPAAFPFFVRAKTTSNSVMAGTLSIMRTGKLLSCCLLARCRAEPANGRIFAALMCAKYVCQACLISNGVLATVPSSSSKD